MIALIPAAANSQLSPQKNMKRVAGKPLIAYTIAAAQQSGIFTRVLVSTDINDAVIWPIIRHFDAPAAIQLQHRPAKYAMADSPDIEWVRDVMPVIREDA